MAGKNFDELLTPDRTFTVRGQTFTWVEVRPEVLSAMGRSLAAVSPNGDSEASEEEQDDAAWKSIDEQIKLFLIPEDRERWDTLRSREEEPVTIKQVNAVLQYLVEEQTDRPTQEPSPSATGPGKTARSSRAGSR